MPRPRRTDLPGLQQSAPTTNRFSDRPTGPCLRRVQDVLRPRPQPHCQNSVRSIMAVCLPVYRVSLVRESTLRYTDIPQMRDSASVARLLQAYLHDTDREHFVVLFLDQKHRLTGMHTVAIGSMTAAVIHPREVFKAAILAQAAAIVCGHNHPSGDVQPSREDRAITTRLFQAGKLLGIGLIDHVIIGAPGVHFSFADEGLLEARES